MDCYLKKKWYDLFTERVNKRIFYYYEKQGNFPLILIIKKIIKE